MKINEFSKKKIQKMLSDFINSSFATTLAEICTLPICTTKTNFQNGNHSNIRLTILSIYNTRGIKGFYKASFPSVSGQVLSTASKYTVFKKLNEINNSHWSMKYLNGILCGLSVSLITHPLDAIKVHMQMDTKELIKKFSFKFFYSGYKWSFIKTCISGPLFFPLCDFCKEETGSIFYGSMTASVIATTIMQPVDYFKTRSLYGNDITFNFKLCFKGLSLNLMRVVPHFIIVMTTIEYLKN